MNALRAAACVGIGAGMMYVLDPAAGRRRRAYIRDKAAHYVRKAACTTDIVSRDIVNRIEGFRHEGFGAASLRKLDVLQSRWAPATRFMMSVGAIGLSFYGVKRGGAAGQLLSLAAGGVLVEALTNTALFEHQRPRRGGMQRVCEHPQKAQPAEPIQQQESITVPPEAAPLAKQPEAMVGPAAT